MLQLVFAFVNAPLLATFLLGMFWKGLPATRVHRLDLRHDWRAIHQGLTLPAGAHAGIKGVGSAWSILIQ